MPFYLYSKNKEDNLYINEGKVSLAGYNILYNLWIEKGKPLNCGWHISQDDIINILFNEQKKDKDYKIIIDLAPVRKDEIILLEIIDIYLYTYGENGEAYWSPLMLKLKNCYYQWNFGERDISKIELNYDDEEIYEFLYLGGDDRSWNWSRVGGVNGALLHKPAREYFKQYFN